MSKNIVEFDLDKESQLMDGVRKLQYWITNNKKLQDTHHIVVIRKLEGEIHFLQKDDFMLALTECFSNWIGEGTLVMADANLEVNAGRWFIGSELKRVPINLIAQPLALLERTTNYFNDKTLVQPKPVDKKSKKYICLNGAAKPHRARLVSDLYDNNYENDGWISWVNRYGKLNHKKHFPNPKFQGEDMVLDHNAESIDQKSNQELLPHQYHYAGFEIVNESIVSDTSIFLTEKIWKPILYRKIFIVNGCKGTMKFLRKNGFEPYNELFNIEFDKLDYIHRYDAMWTQIEKLMKHTASDWTEIYQDKIIKQKLEHNSHIFKFLKEKNWRTILNEL